MNQIARNLFGVKMTALYLTLLAITIALVNPSSHAAENEEGFDHFTTGFPLTGKHEFIDCSSCHIGGQFKGTPMECVLCHNNGRAPGKHAQHIVSSNLCDDCHTTKTWRGARFDHSGVFAPCETCHNNSMALGLPPTHIAVISRCEDCHNTLSFSRVGRVDHGSVIGTCGSCHNGVTATGKHPAHPQTTQECDVCHTTNTWLGAGFDHTGVTSGCSSCHNGVRATGKHAAHLPTTTECGSCHNTTTWLGAIFDHSGASSACSSCHNGVSATGKHAAHLPTTLDCERCHLPARWIPLTTFRHDSPDYPGDHRTTVLCVDCHRTNNQVIAWPFPAYQPDCAGCHANDYIPGPHDNATVSELRDCAGSCHVGGNNRSNEHRPSADGW